MGQEVMMRGWQLAIFGLGNQVFAIAAVWFVYWLDKRRHCCLGPEVPCDKHKACNFEHGEGL